MGIVRRPFRPVIDYCVGMAALAGQPPHPLVPELIQRILDAMTERAGPGAFTQLAPEAGAAPTASA
nr:hypothetical protein [Achromobacter insuavis]